MWHALNLILMRPTVLQIKHTRTGAVLFDTC